MHSDIHTPEESLAQLKPQPLSEELLARLDDAMCAASSSENHITSTKAEKEPSLEEILEHLQPAPASAELLDRLDSAMSRWHESVPIEEKIVTLSSDSQTQPQPKKERKPWIGWKSAAAVAALGVSMAFVSEHRVTDPAENVANSSEISSGAIIQPARLIPANAQAHQLQSARIQRASYNFTQQDANFVGLSERGLMVAEDGKIYRCIEATFNDQYRFQAASTDGTLTIEKPRREIILEPVVAD